MKKIIGIFLIFIFWKAQAFGQKVEVDISACQSMSYLLQTMKTDVSRERAVSLLDSILQSKPYQIMFKHYNRAWRPNHLPLEVFKRMILSLKYPEAYQKGENQRADQMLLFWQGAWQDLASFQKSVQIILAFDLKSAIQKGVIEAQKWLPEKMKIPDFYFFVHPNGGSTAFAIEDNQGYDFFQLDKDSLGNLDVASLVETVAHESHHLGLDIKQPSFKTKEDSLAFRFLLTFVAEGSASKLVDNLPGGLFAQVNANSAAKNFPADIAAIWQTYTRQEKTIFKEFERDFQKIYQKKYNLDSIQKRIQTYWLNGKKGRAYFLGSELYGAVYQAFGKAKTLEMIEKPHLLLKTYNRAVWKIRRKLKAYILLSKWLSKIL
jgi:hypothetical protein